MKKKQVIALLCSMSIMIVSLTGCGFSQAAAEIKVAASIEEMDSVVKTLEEANVIKHSSLAGKEETVYVLLDANGNQSETIVSEWLKNPEGAEQVADVSNLSDVKVVKGEAYCSLKENAENELVWTTDGSDIYYQGKSDHEVPVIMKVTYELDGKVVDATALDHADGHLKITYDYENQTAKQVQIQGEERTIYQPFTMISGAMFGNEHVANITVEGGKAINSGDYTIVLGMAMPGLSESLGLDEIEQTQGKEITVPTAVTIEADVMDFTMPMTVTVASNNALEEIGISDFDSLDDLKEKSNKLTDGMNQLMDGAAQLNDGVSALSDGTLSLWDGTLDLMNGAGDLKNGANTLADGAKEVNDGAHKLADGTNQVNTGAGQLKDGLHTLQEKTPALSSGVGKLVEGAGQLNSGLGQVNANNEALNAGVQSLVDGSNTLADALNPESESMQALRAGAAGVSAGISQAKEGAESLLSSYQSVATNMSDLVSAIEDCVNSLSGEAPGEEASAEEWAAYAAKQEAAGQLMQVLSQVKDGVTACSNGLAAINEKTGELVGSLDTLATGAGALNTAVNDTLVASLTQAQTGAAALNAGATQLQGGISAYTAGVSTCSAGTATLSDGLTSLQGQLPALTDGVNQLVAGADQLKNGTNELATGAGNLANGTQALSDGAGTLADGTRKLAAGTGDLHNGVSQLSDGVAELLDGSGQLKDGVAEFNEEGISKITDLINNDIEKYYDRLCAVRDYAKEYKSFAGVSDQIDSAVKFIYKTEGI